MKIVIDIPEDILKNCQTGEHAKKSIYFDYLLDVIRKGTILPKEHGRLIDADKLLSDIERKNPLWWNDQGSKKAYARLVYYWAVRQAPTIIMSNKEEE